MNDLFSKNRSVIHAREGDFLAAYSEDRMACLTLRIEKETKLSGKRGEDEVPR